MILIRFNLQENANQILKIEAEGHNPGGNQFTYFIVCQDSLLIFFGLEIWF